MTRQKLGTAWTSFRRIRRVFILSRASVKKAIFLVACSRPSVGGAVRRAPGERGKNEGIWEGRARERLSFLPRPLSLPLSRFDSLTFSLAAVFVRHHQFESLEQAIFLEGFAPRLVPIQSRCKLSSHTPFVPSHERYFRVKETGSQSRNNNSLEYDVFLLVTQAYSNKVKKIRVLPTGVEPNNSLLTCSRFRK